MHHSQLTSFSRTIKQCEVQRQRCRLVTACCVIQWQQPNRMQTWTSQLRTGQLSTFASSLAHWSSQDSCSSCKGRSRFCTSWSWSWWLVSWSWSWGRPQRRSLESQTAGLQSLWLASRLKPWLRTIGGLWWLMAANHGLRVQTRKLIAAN